MAAIGSAVGLGNLWRFPARAFANGGGAFFIPYFIALLSAGIPLVIVEYAIGQKYQGGAPQALAAVTKKFRWVGWMALLVGSVIVMYYVVVMAYAWHFSVASFGVNWTKPASYLEWKKKEEGNVETYHVRSDQIEVCLQAPTEKAFERLKEIQLEQDEDKRLPVYTAEELRELEEAQEEKDKEDRTYYVTLDENVANYFFENCLGGFHPGLWSLAGTARKLRAEAAGLEKKAEDLESEERAEEAESLKKQAREKLAKADRLEAGYGPDAGRKFSLNKKLVLGAVFTWVIIFLIIFKGVKNVGRVVMLTVPLPVILLLIILLRGVTLPGAAEGLLYYLKPNWTLLQDPKIWLEAYGQVFFSLSLGFGILIAYASYMPEESDVTNSALITSFGNCATSFVAGLAVFSVLGYLAYVRGGVPVEDVVAGGPGLVFVTYPIALAKMPMGQWAIGIISFLFFICLVSLGIDSAFSLVEGIVTGFRDKMKKIGKPTLTGIFCVIGCLGSIFICTRSGLMWLDILDRWMSNYGLALVGLLECIAVGYFFNIEELKDYINKHSEIEVHNWFNAFVKFITPAILVILLGRQFFQDISGSYGGYDQIVPHAIHVGGWGVFFSILLLALIFGKSWKIVTWVGIGALITLVLFLYFGENFPEKPGSELFASALMGAVAIALLFGGLITCIYIARKTHHMAGLAVESTDEEETHIAQDSISQDE